MVAVVNVIDDITEYMKGESATTDAYHLFDIDIDAEYGNIVKMNITQGKVHKELGMTIDYSSPGKVILSTVDYVVNVIDYITEYMKGESATTDAYHLFDIEEDTTKLS